MVSVIEEPAQRPAKRMKMEHNNGVRGEKSSHGKRGRSKPSFNNASASGINSDDVGIFFTCDKGQEKKCMTEFYDLLSQYIDEPASTTTSTKEDSEVDIEADIRAELASMKPTKTDLKMIMLDIPCVSFARLPPHADPVSLVHRICRDALDNPTHRRSRYLKRMTPISLMRKTLGGLEQLCDVVLKPHFHSGGPSKKFAIRPSVRNNNQLDRDTLIKTVAAAVGPEHRVDLTNYDLLILVDVYRNVVGMSVVGKEFEEMRKFNLAEIYSPTLRPMIEEKETVEAMVESATSAAIPTMEPVLAVKPGLAEEEEGDAVTATEKTEKGKDGVFEEAEGCSVPTTMGDYDKESEYVHN